MKNKIITIIVMLMLYSCTTTNKVVSNNLCNINERCLAA